MKRSSIFYSLFVVAALICGIALLQAGVPGDAKPWPPLPDRLADIEQGFGMGKPSSDILLQEFDVEPLEMWTDARFALNSVAMRDCKAGGINLVGPPPGSQLIQAFLYWQWGTLEEPIPRKHDEVIFKQVFPLKIGSPIVGTLIGVAPNPCWGPNNYQAFTYRADVTPFMSPTGGGSYGVLLKNGSAGSFDYQDPFAPVLHGCPASPHPLFEGAVLVVIYHSSCEPNGMVMLYDAPLPNNMYLGSPGIMYNLLHPPVPPNLLEARWAQATCDGQTGFGYVDIPGLALENTFINGFFTAGPGSIVTDSDVNGAVGKPLPQLFDTTGHDVTPYLFPGLNFTNVQITDPSGAGGDCLITNLNLLFFR